ncbi:MAG TPA: tetratricopeptide repeat protein [Verrucomicrobiae bacterium]
MLLRRLKKRSAVGLHVPWLLILCLLMALKPFVRAESSGDSPAATPAILLSEDYGGSNAVQHGIVTSNGAVREIVPPSAGTNPPSAASLNEQKGTNGFNASLVMARYLENARQPEKAEPILVGLLAENVPDSIQKSALLELGATVREENDLPRAQTIYSQFLNRWPNDVKVPEILLRQGEIFREMGLNDMALGKFYSVMTSALALKNDQLAYYQSLVLQTQVEIAGTHYLMGRFADAADFYSRLLQKTDPALNRPQMQFRLIRSLAIIGRNDEAVGQAQDFLSRYADADEEPEVRYYLAEALKALGRNNEALQQVLLCLQEQKVKTKNDPEVWAYWQQRVGNEIANQLYREGDYVRALEVYINLAQLDSSPAWQVPVDYQMGMTYEKLLQPQKAIDTYNQILARETEVGTNATPGLKAVFDMARWRAGFIGWQTNAEAIDHSLAELSPSANNSNNTQASKNE